MLFNLQQESKSNTMSMKNKQVNISSALGAHRISNIIIKLVIILILTIMINKEDSFTILDILKIMVNYHQISYLNFIYGDGD